MTKKNFDVESAGDGANQQNSTIHTFSWDSLNVSIYDKAVGGHMTILSNVQGSVEAGMYNLL